ncbi:RelA/SpoT domain-containing protein [Methylomonas paludis]|uniref:RelA/SpoT domain-containing protein n=1 Tax=Methylomonas paludis TaxID=1173101 RepID=A0A975R8G8_9GAMM|nr:RelA/SpoT domain-containing protein [Methylomonas paludis]QWF69977.1 RelA/SpoT domain-containing protein [Methylomonas paludis]
MNLAQYLAGQQDLYKEFAELVEGILEASIRGNRQLRLQQVQSRAKNPASLKGKLEKAGLLESNAIEDDIKDLAGCRLIFYTNSDVAAFLSSGILQEQFKVDWERTKFHHPVPMASEKPRLFISNNFVVELKEELAQRPEFERFRGIRCEVQVQTILNHAWSEMEHDILYKRPRLEGFGGRLMSDIDERMQKIMRDYLIPAGYEFQKVVNDFERLSSGKALFDEAPLLAIQNCQNNNELHERLTSFNQHVLPHFDDLEAVQNDVRKTVLAAMMAAQSRKAKPIDTSYGQLEGHTTDQLMSLVADILDRFRYLGEEGVINTFDAICILYDSATSDNQRKRLISSAKNLSEHSLAVWQQAGGPVVESILVERIHALDLNRIVASKAVVLEVLGQVLRPEVRGSSSTYNTFTIKAGAVTPSDLLVNVRSAAIDILLSVFRAATSDKEKKVVLQKLSEASRTPTMGNYSNALLAIALNDTARIVRFLTEVSAEQSYILLEEFEHHCLWHYRRSNSLPPSMAQDQEVARARDGLNQAILAFRDRVNTDQRFVIFKTLVGYQTVFPPAWEGGDFDIHGIDEYRKMEIAKLVDQVSEKTAEEWLQIITICANTSSDDRATFPSFCLFLEQLGKTKPEIVLCYLDRLDNELTNFLSSMLLGLEQSGLKEAAIKQIWTWIGEGKYARQVIRYCEFASTLDLSLQEEALQVAIRADDEVGIFHAIRASVARYKDAPDNMTELVFLPALRYLTDRGRHEWINAVWPRSENQALFSSLAPEQEDEVLASMVICPHIDYDAEQILQAIAAQSPEKVIDFFEKRVAYEKGLQSSHGYEEIPYKFQDLRETLQQIPELLVAKVRKWFASDNELFAYRGGRMIAAVFPEPEDQLLKPLHELAGTGKPDDVEFVIEVLKNYQGQIVLHDLFKDLIEALPEDSPLMGEISVVLDSVGVVNGEFGHVETYLRKKDEIKPWLEDPREKVRAFAHSQTLSLERQIADEQRRAEQGLELRKRNYGE